MTEPKSLAELEADFDRQRRLLNLPPKPWMPVKTGPNGAAVLDVAIVGAGLCGLVAHAALEMEGITNVRLLDRAPARTRRAPGSPMPAWRPCARSRKRPVRRLASRR